MSLSRVVAAVLVASMGIGTGHAQTYPTQTVRILVSFAPGGSVDVATRAIAAKLSETLGKPFIVENRPGAGGQVAVRALLAAAADGHTLLATTNGAITVGPHLERLDYDPVADLAPVALPGWGTLVLAVATGSSIQTLGDLIVASKQAPGGMNYGMAGIGTLSHLAAELFNRRTGANLIAIPYQGAAPVTQALVSGEVSVAISDSTTLRPHLDSGKVRLLANLRSNRSESLPDVPTVAESGYPDYAVNGWYGIFARAATSGEIVERLHGGIEKVLATPSIRSILTREGFDSNSMSTTDARRFIAAESRTWADVILAAGFKLN